VNVHVILATVNFYLQVIVCNYDSSISPELIYLTKNEGNNNSLVSEVLLFFFFFVSSSFLAFMFICSCGTIVDLVDIDFSCDEVLNLFSVSFTHF